MLFGRKGERKSRWSSNRYQQDNQKKGISHSRVKSKPTSATTSKPQNVECTARSFVEVLDRNAAKFLQSTKSSQPRMGSSGVNEEMPLQHQTKPSQAKPLKDTMSKVQDHAIPEENLGSSKDKTGNVSWKEESQAV